MNSESLKTYLIITFSLSILLSIYVGLIDRGENVSLLRILAMPIPALTVIIMARVLKDPVRDSSWSRLPVRWLLPALLVFPLSIHVVSLPLVVFQNDMTIPWQSWLTADESGVFHSPEERGWGDLTRGQLVYRLTLNAFVGLIIVSIMAFFEEIGWRAWMLPRLIHRFSVKKGLFISAVIWAMWHIPFVLSGLNLIPGISMGAMILIYPIGLIGAGLVIGWLWIRSKSIWIVCIAHGALNNWGQYAFKFMKDGPSDPSGFPWLYIGVNAALILIGLIVWVNIKSENNLEVSLPTDN